VVRSGGIILNFRAHFAAEYIKPELRQITTATALTREPFQSNELYDSPGKVAQCIGVSENCSPDWAVEYTNESWTKAGRGGPTFAYVFEHTPAAEQPESAFAQHTKTCQYLTTMGKKDLTVQKMTAELFQQVELHILETRKLKRHEPDHLEQGVPVHPGNKNRLKTTSEKGRGGGRGGGRVKGRGGGTGGAKSTTSK
jgi:hypothetical protein